MMMCQRMQAALNKTINQMSMVKLADLSRVMIVGVNLLRIAFKNTRRSARKSSLRKGKLLIRLNSVKRPMPLVKVLMKIRTQSE